MTIEITFKHDTEKYPTKIKDLLKKYGIRTDISNEEAVQILQRTPQFVQDTQDYAQERENYKKMSNEELLKLPQCDEKWIMSYNKSKIIIVDEKTELTRISFESKDLEQEEVLKAIAMSMAIPLENTGPCRIPNILAISKDFEKLFNVITQYLQQFKVDCEIDGKIVPKEEIIKASRKLTPEQNKIEDEAEDIKKQGNLHFIKKENKEAIELYTKAIELLSKEGLYTNNEPKELLGVLYSNRAAAYLNLEDNKNALEDAESSLKYKPFWDKSHFRKTKALLALNRKKDAIKSLCNVLKAEDLTEDEEKRLLNILIDVTGLNSDKVDDIVAVIDDHRYEKEDALLIAACHQLLKLVLNEEGLIKKKEVTEEEANAQAQEITDKIIKQLAAKEKASDENRPIDSEEVRKQIAEDEPEWAGEEQMLKGLKKMHIQKDFVERGIADRLAQRFIKHKNPILQQYGRQFAETHFAWSEEGQKAYNEQGFELFAEDLGINGAMRMGFL
ncbi:hypothetical protein H8356DRAFT_1000417 [Neocallimastix lanati (nom. inval.)]|jgi:hypothetical protein|nr:hypothetical protein H8356DRAFT_1000417 [Neocallimastix sp. JGI-2020a]